MGTRWHRQAWQTGRTVDKTTSIDENKTRTFDDVICFGDFASTISGLNIVVSLDLKIKKFDCPFVIRYLPAMVSNQKNKIYLEFRLTDL